MRYNLQYQNGTMEMSLEFIKGAWKNKDSTIWLIFIRLIVGVEWFIGTLGFFASGNPNAWYVNLINNSFIPNAELFAWLVSIGELLIGIALIFGILVNISAIVSFFLNLNFYFAAAWISPSTQSINWVLMILGLIILLSPGVKSLSVDLFISERWPKLRRFLVDWFGFGKSKD